MAGADRDDLRYARALLDGGAIGRLHLTALRPAGRLVPRESRFTGTPWRQQYGGGVHHIAQILVFTGDTIGNCYRAQLVDFADAVRFGVRPVGSVVQFVANAMVVKRALDSAERAAVLALDPVSGAGPAPLWRLRGSTGLFRRLQRRPVRYASA